MPEKKESGSERKREKERINSFQRRKYVEISVCLQDLGVRETEN